MMKKIFEFCWETLKIILVALVVVLPIRYLVFQPFIVKGSSMEPNFQEGNYLIIDELSYRWRQPKRGEVVVFRPPHDPSQRYIKRIIGLPAETLEIKEGKIEVFEANSQRAVLILREKSYLPPDDLTPGHLRLTLGENEYFVLGDNRFSSSDSRSWGVLPRANIIGRVFLRLWPLTELGEIIVPSY